MRLFRDTPDERLVEICEEFLADRASPKHESAAAQNPGKATARSALAISEDLTRRWKQAGVDFKVSREEIYFVLGEAKRRGLFTVTPRTHEELRKQLCARYRLPQDRIRVVASESYLPDHVARHAAQLIVEQIFQLWPQVRAQKNRVHLGFGAGGTTRVVAYQLAKLLQEQQGEIPPLALHAISCGFQPRTAPVVLFGFFESVLPRVELVGMFGPPYADWNQYKRICNQPGLREAFERRDEIDLLVTSLASFDDPHGGLWEHMSEHFAKDMLPQLEASRWRGDLQLCPFNAEGPIAKKRGDRAVTLFDLHELVALAQREEKRVVLVSPPCSHCGLTRAPALAPLLRVQSLRAWSHLVTDVPTVRELLELAVNPQAPRVCASTFPRDGFGEGGDPAPPAS